MPPVAEDQSHRQLSPADRDARHRFQSSLLTWLRAAGNPTPESGVALREMIAVLRAQTLDDPGNALLWRSAEAFLAALLDGTLPTDGEARQLCRRLERQLSRPAAASDATALNSALFDFVSQRTALPEGPTTSSTGDTLQQLGLPLKQAAELLPWVGQEFERPERRLTAAQATDWQRATQSLSDAWHDRLRNTAESCRSAALALVDAALGSNDSASLMLAEAMAESAGAADEIERATLPAFRAAFDAALELAAHPDGPDQNDFGAKATAMAERLASARQATAGKSLAKVSPWFLEDAEEWLAELAAGMEAVPPQRLVLISTLDWFADQEACNVMAVRGLATLARQVIGLTRGGDLDTPEMHGLVSQIAQAIRHALTELTEGHAPRPDEALFAELRRRAAQIHAWRTPAASGLE